MICLKRLILQNNFYKNKLMNKYRNSNAANSTKTYNKLEIENPTDNIYEAISIIAKRSGQINSEIKKELHDKLDEFATHNDSLEEIFENKEQIEVSKFYEKLPKPYAIAIEEWLENKIYYRDTEADTEQ
tara:strand:- start:87 stop:473 length:387 start_codon:yes stop_codon:yes gene_type:complete